MSQATIRKLIIFLLINMVLAIYITTSYFIKAKDEKKEEVAEVSTKVSEEPAKPELPEQATLAPTNQEPPKEAVAEAVQPSVPLVKESVPSPYKFKLPSPSAAENIGKEAAKNVAAAPVKAVEPEMAKVCIQMGPFTTEEKTTMDFILNKNKETELAKVEKMKSHQIYWNLGKNKAEADKLFAQQKAGAMENPKYVLSQNKNKEWVVNITKVYGDENLAFNILKGLEKKAQKVKAGGEWEYDTLPEGYFFRFNDFKSLKEVTINSIDATLKPSKDPC